MSRVALVGGSLLSKLLWFNIALAVFNLLPAFPMDGGRVLRAVLATRMEYVRATQIAASVGQAMAFLFGLVGLFTNPFLVFIALFVWIGAAQESSMIQMKSALGGIPVSHVMITDFRTLSPHDTLGQVAEHILSGFQHDFPVIEDGYLTGMLTRGDLLKALAQHPQTVRVEEVAQRDFETASPLEMLESVFTRLQSSSCHSLPIAQDGQLVGLITMENVGEFLMVQSALHKTHTGRRAATISDVTKQS